MEGTLFLLELLLVGVLGVLACAGLVAFGGAVRNGPGLLALGIYMIGYGLGLSLIPQLRWPVARTDNAFLGQFMLSLVLLGFGLILAASAAVSLVRHAQLSSAAGRALVLAAVGLVLSLVLLIVRGPEPWQTRPTDAFGSGTFGFDIIMASVAIGVLVLVIGRRTGRTGQGDS
jgi:hypothetical protein